MESDSSVGFAADGHAVSGVEVVVEDAHVGGGAVARLDGDVVVAGANEGVGDGDVAGLRGIDAVGVARGAGRVDLDAPDGEAVAAVEGDVEVGRIFEGDAVESEVVGEVGFDEAGNLLSAGGAGVFGEVPPGLVGGTAVEEDFGSALSVDGAVAHDG